MKIVITAAILVVPVGAVVRESMQAAQARAKQDVWVRERQQAAQEARARQQRENEAVQQRELEERRRNQSLAEQARQCVPRDSPLSDAKPAAIQGNVLVWDTTTGRPALSDAQLPAALRWSDAESRVTALLIVAKWERKVRTYRMARTEAVWEPRRPRVPSPYPAAVRPGGVPMTPDNDIWNTPGVGQGSVLPRVRQIETGQVVEGYRLDLDVAMVYLPAKKFVGVFRVTGDDPPANISRSNGDLRPEYGPTDGKLLKWISSCQRASEPRTNTATP
jgi:hypothetical protein